MTEGPRKQRKRKPQRRTGGRPPRNLRPAPLGLIKVGKLGKPTTSRSGKQFQPAQKFDYFLLCHPHRSTAKDDDKNYAVDIEAMQAHIPDWKPGMTGPKVLPVMLFSHIPEENAYYEWAFYDGSARRCYNNDRPGESAACWLDEHGDEIDRSCPCELREQGQCKDRAILRCALLNVPRVGGAWILSTTAKGSSDALFESMDRIRQVTGGYLAGLPLQLEVSWRTARDKDGKHHGVPLINITFPGTLPQLVSVARQIAGELTAGRGEIKALMAGQPEPQLPSIKEEVVDTEDSQAVAAEFYPSPEIRAEMDADDDGAPPSERDHEIPWRQLVDPDEAAALYDKAEAVGIPPARWRMELERFGSLEEAHAYLDARSETAAEESEAESGPEPDDTTRATGREAEPAGAEPDKADSASTSTDDRGQSEEPGSADSSLPTESAQDAVQHAFPGFLDREDYVRLEALHASMKQCGSDIADMPAFEGMDREAYLAHMQLLKAAWGKFSKPEGVAAMTAFEARCLALEITKDFK